MASTYLSRSFTTPTNAKKYTISVWVKRSSFASDQFIISTKNSGTSNRSFLEFLSTNVIRWGEYTNGVGYLTQLDTNSLYRDCNGWYHIVLSFDSTQATSSNRTKLYVNGEQITSFSTENYITQNTDSYTNSATDVNIGRYIHTSTSYLDGSLTHFHFIDGTAYAASDFGETDSTTGIWKPKTAPSVTYGTNGFFLKFENSGSMGTDSSGNANNFTVNGTLTQTEDTPSNVFATLNANIANTTGFTITLSNGNTQSYNPSTSYFAGYPSTLGVSSGKYYWEYKLVSVGSGSTIYTAIGVTSENYINYVASATRGDPLAGGTSSAKAESYEYLVYNGKKINNGTSTAHGDTMTTGDIAMVALDLDNNYIYFGKNGTWQNSSDPTSGATGTGAAFSLTTGLSYFPVLDQYYLNTTAMNFGNGYFGTTAVSSAQNPDDGIGIFEYDVPTGYRALCTKSINAEEYS